MDRTDRTDKKSVARGEVEWVNLEDAHLGVLQGCAFIEQVVRNNFCRYIG